MIKNIHVNELIFSDYFVNYPVEQVNEKLSNETTKNNIILASGRGSGKSVILKSREKNSIKTENPAFYTSFAGEGIFGKKENEYFNSEIMEHYYEVVMANKFINYVKLNYPEVFYSRFKRLSDISESKITEIDNYINNVIYDGRKLDDKFVSGELVGEALDLFKKDADVKDVTLMIDRFDWTHNSDPRVQKILEKYFDLFDKTIFTADDHSVGIDVRASGLEKKGYEVVKFGYSREPGYIREIVNRRIIFDDDYKEKLPIDSLSDEDFENIIQKCNGNISSMLEVFLQLDSANKYDKISDMSETADKVSDEKSKVYHHYRQMYQPPRLYL